MSLCKSLLTLFCVIALTAGVTYAQSDVPAQTRIAGSDVAAASSVTSTWYRILPAATAAAKNLPPSALSNKTVVSKAAIPQPGFFPADLAYHGGPVVTSAEHDLVFFDCPAGPATCWGSPGTFLRRLNDSAFIHLTDQYVGTTANFRYPVGGTVSVN